LSSVKGLDYRKNLVAELMKRIPPVPLKTTSKVDKLTNRLAQHNPKIYDGKFDAKELEE